jgi:hypothetical protein
MQPIDQLVATLNDHWLVLWTLGCDDFHIADDAHLMLHGGLITPLSLYKRT